MGKNSLSTSRFDKGKSITRINGAINMFALLIALNILGILWFISGYTGRFGLNRALIYPLIGSFFSSLICLILMRGFSSIKEYLNDLSEQIQK